MCLALPSLGYTPATCLYVCLVLTSIYIITVAGYVITVAGYVITVAGAAAAVMFMSFHVLWLITILLLLS